jgi:hypothetical protein
VGKATVEIAYFPSKAIEAGVVPFLAEPGAPAGDLTWLGLFREDGGLYPVPPFDATQMPDPTATAIATMPMSKRRLR